MWLAGDARREPLRSRDVHVTAVHQAACDGEWREQTARYLSHGSRCMSSDNASPRKTSGTDTSYFNYLHRIVIAVWLLSQVIIVIIFVIVIATKVPDYQQKCVQSTEKSVNYHHTLGEICVCLSRLTLL